jgi:hypothetical protein
LSAPPPPADINRRQPLVLDIPAGVQLHRFYTKGPAWTPIYFDRSTAGRLNAPAGAYGVLYCAQNSNGAFAETFLRKPGRQLLPPDLLAAKGYAVLRTTESMRMVRLFGPGLARLGATAEVTHGGLPYDVPQQWSAALVAHYQAFDGIAYYARHDDDEVCYAIFDRAIGKIEELNRQIDLDQDWFYAIMARYGVGLAFG